jgi:translation initiation factor 3 subunit F
MPRIRVDPVVVFNILDHYIRRNENQTSVIGALLGSKSPDGSMEIRNCFPVPHTEGSEHLSIDVEFQRVMKELYQKVDSKNLIVGWYSTSYTENSHSLHDFYERNIPNFIHLIVDPSLKGGHLNVKTLISQSLTIGNRTIGPFFKEVAFEWKTLDAELVAFAMMMQHLKKSKVIPPLSSPSLTYDKPEQDIEEDEETISGPSADNVPSAIAGAKRNIGGRTWIGDDTLQITMTRLYANLNRAYQYTSNVLQGTVKEDKDIGRALCSVISDVSMISNSVFDKVFNDSLQDMLMVIYLSKLSKAQVLLNEKLHNTFTS